VLTPQAPSYRRALFALGELYYEGKKYTQAINILGEAVDRYGEDPEVGHALFVAADSYRQCGLALDRVLNKLAGDPTETVSREKTAELRRRYLDSARDYYSRTIEFFERTPDGRRGVLEDLYLRHGYLYRADCMFDLQRYREALPLYEAAVMRYQLTPTALSAFIQMVNCHIRLGNTTEARSTNERALWQLRKIPDSELLAGPRQFTRQQWEDWFSWVPRSGLW